VFALADRIAMMVYGRLIAPGATRADGNGGMMVEGNSMRHATIFAAGFAAVLVTLAAAPAFAGYGAVAFDEKAAKYGFGWNEATQKIANEAALKACNSADCKVVIPVPPRRCAALATGEKGNAWGGNVNASRDAAKLRALENCQKNTTGKCILRGSDCNR
jgi:hypothetical protein